VVPENEDSPKKPKPRAKKKEPARPKDSPFTKPMLESVERSDPRARNRKRP
jgi:hypothetical protein